jgi:hypothetical protein
VGFRLKQDQPVADEIRRIVIRQFELAAGELRDVGNPNDDAAIHRARRRMKKVRALIRLVRPTLGDTFDRVDRRLRKTAHLLAPIADGQGIVHALDELADKYRSDFSPAVFDTIRAGLVEREVRADRKAKVDRLLQRVRSALRKERNRVAIWEPKGGGFRDIADGLETGYRRARKALATALKHPTADNYHRWRRRVKDSWFHVRVIETRCGNRLASYERRLETLDECLGQYHNFALLRGILAADPFVSRQETARRLRLIRRYQAELRQRARSLGTSAYRERPGHFVRRVRALWRLANLVEPRHSTRTCRQHASA